MKLFYRSGQILCEQHKQYVYCHLCGNSELLLSTDFQNVCSSICDKLNAQLCQENILSRFKQLQNICEKPHRAASGDQNQDLSIPSLMLYH